MHRFLGMTRWGALFVTGWLLAALPGCGSSADVASCTSRSCDGYGAGGNDATADATAREDADASSVADAPSDAPGDVGATDEPRISQSCYIQPAEAGAGVTTQCAPVGQVGEGGACDDSSDCIALDACVDVD